MTKIISVTSISSEVTHNCKSLGQLAGAYVHSYVEHDIDLSTLGSLGFKPRSRRMLDVGEGAASLFGEPGSLKYSKTLANAVDIGQICLLISEQVDGQGGVLLNNGAENIFPVRGKDNLLHIIRVWWNSHPNPLYNASDPFVWNEPDRLFAWDIDTLEAYHLTKRHGVQLFSNEDLTP